MQRLIAIVLLAVVWAGAQDPRGTITGQVTDASGAVVSGAAIRATNVDTGVKVSAVSNAQGNYEILYLSPGTYKLEAEMKGFNTWTRSGVELRMEDRMQVDVRLALGNVTQSVEVTAEAPLLENADANVGQVVGSKQVAELPERGASLASVHMMAPGRPTNEALTSGSTPPCSSAPAASTPWTCPCHDLHRRPEYRPRQRATWPGDRHPDRPGRPETD